MDQSLNAALSEYEILENMQDMVRVVDRHSRVVFQNRSMRRAARQNPMWRHCFNCRNCVSRRAMEEGRSAAKEETIGALTYSVLASPAIVNGRTVGAVEVFRDITEERRNREALVRHSMRMEQDLHMARNMQQAFHTPSLSRMGPYRFAGAYQPCETVGGDLYEIVPLDERRVFFYIADVAGHGVTAAMLTVFIKMAMFYEMREHMGDLAGILAGVQRRFLELDMADHHYITVFAGVLYVHTGRLAYVSAGHNAPPILVRAGAVERLVMPGMPISTWPGAGQWRSQDTRLAPGDALVLYTDGLEEALGERELESRAAAAFQPEREPEAALRQLLQGARTNKGMNDDITAMAIVRMLAPGMGK